jgi:hypothetical protein
MDDIEDEKPRQRFHKRLPKAIVELNECMRDIQNLPGFGQFQKGLSAKQMRECAADGCIVVVNVTDLRSDAIIVSSSRFRAIPLRNLDASTVAS